MNADDAQGQLSVQVKLTSLTDSSISSDSKTFIIKGFLTHQQNVNQATINWSLTPTEVNKNYPSSLTADNLNTKTSQTFENLVTQSNISNQKAFGISLDKANDLTGSVVVNYNVQYTVNGVTYTSSKAKSFVLTNLLTYLQDLNQTTASFALNSDITKASVLASSITSASLNSTLVNNVNSSLKVEIINLLANDNEGSLGIIYQVQLSVNNVNYASV